MIAFFVHGIPKGQPRPRAFARQIGGRIIARVFDAGTAEAWKGQVAIHAKSMTPTSPLSGPLRLDLDFYLPRPKAHYLKSGLRPTAPVYHTGKPDRDNLEKAVMDALTLLGFWLDDGQVCAGEIRKFYADSPTKTGCEIKISEISVTPS